MHSWTTLSLSLQAQATETVRPAAHDANSDWWMMSFKRNICKFQCTLQKGITLFQSIPFGSFQQCIFFTSWESVHQEQEVLIDPVNAYASHHCHNQCKWVTRSKAQPDLSNEECWVVWIFDTPTLIIVELSQLSGSRAVYHQVSDELITSWNKHSWMYSLSSTTSFEFHSIGFLSFTIMCQQGASRKCGPQSKSNK